MLPCTSPRRGQVALCRKGLVGVVTHETQYFDNAKNSYRTRYLGVSLEGFPWESVDPTWLAPTLSDYIRVRYEPKRDDTRGDGRNWLG